MKRTNRGILYIVFGELYIKEALISAKSIKKISKDLDITLMCDKYTNSKYIDNCLLIQADHIRAKVDYIHKTPYEETIFLDSDTIANHDLSEMFSILERYDFSICHDYARKRKYVSELIPEYEKIPYVFSEVNPGVMVFRNNSAVQGFFKNWRTLFYKYQSVMPWEQPTFRAALWQSELNFYIMPTEYNVRSMACREKQDKNHDLFGEDHLKPRIYHMHANQKISQGEFKIKTVRGCYKECVKNAVKI